MTLDQWVLFLVGMSTGFLLGLAVAYRYTEKHVAKAWAAAQEANQDEGEENWVCALCGCTNEHACEGGCYWVYPNLCSACAEKLAGLQSERRMYPISLGYGDTLIIECDQRLPAADMQKWEESIRNMIKRAAVEGPGPGFLFLGQGIRLVGVIHGNERSAGQGPRAAMDKGAVT